MGTREPASPAPARIYFVGAHATGKTTLARYVRDRYGLPLISEVARSILAELEVDLDRLRANLDLVNCYQVEVFRRQIEAEREAGHTFVSDRAFCNLAYMAHHGTVMHELFRDPALEAYMRWVAGGLVFFVRPHPELAQSDGVRTATRFEDIVLIDGMVKLLLEMYAVPYLTIATLSMQERVRMVDEVIRLRYPQLGPIRGTRRREETAAAAEPATPAVKAAASAAAPAAKASAQKPGSTAPVPGSTPPPTPSQTSPAPSTTPGMPAIPSPAAGNGGLTEPLLARYRDRSLDLTPDS